MKTVTNEISIKRTEDGEPGKFSFVYFIDSVLYDQKNFNTKEDAFKAAKTKVKELKKYSKH